MHTLYLLLIRGKGFVRAGKSIYLKDFSPPSSEICMLEIVCVCVLEKVA